MLQLKGKRAVVVGGGKIATRKVRSLLDAEANVAVVSLNITRTLRQWYTKRQITWYKRHFHPRDLHGAFIVIAATNDSETNRKIASYCHPYQLVNVASEAGLGNFQTPATFRRGRLTIAVSTAGASPLLAKAICDDLSQKYDRRYEAYVERLARERMHIMKTVTDPAERKARLEKMLEK